MERNQDIVTQRENKTCCNLEEWQKQTDLAQQQQQNSLCVWATGSEISD